MRSASLCTAFEAVANEMRAMSVVKSAIAAVVVAITGLLGAFWAYRKRRDLNQPPPLWREVAQLEKIHLYPLKSGARVELQSAECKRFGLMQNPKIERALQLRDRSFVVVDSVYGEFKTARTFPQMVLIEVGVHDEHHVRFDAPGMRQLYVEIPTNTPSTLITLAKKEEVFAIDCGDEAAVWCSRYILGKDVGLRLAFHDAAEEHQRDLRSTNQELLQTHAGLVTAMGLYSDLTAVTLINTSSVDDLQAKIPTTSITPENFRGNLIIAGDGAPPFIEDYWEWLKIGNVVLRNVKPCTRCTLTTVDPTSGTRNKNREPLNTLEKYRKVKAVFNQDFEGDLPVMGINLGVHQEGEINVGDTIYVGIWG